MNYKYSSVMRPFLKKLSFNACTKQNLRNFLEEIIFNEVLDGFGRYREGDPKVCPIKIGDTYYSKNAGKLPDISNVPVPIPVGEFRIDIDYYNGKNLTYFNLKFYISLLK